MQEGVLGRVVATQVTMKSIPRLSHKLTAARRSLTVWFSALVPVVLAGAETLKDQLPSMSSYLVGWRMVAASVVVSIIVAALRLRGVAADAGQGE